VSAPSREDLDKFIERGYLAVEVIDGTEHFQTTAAGERFVERSERPLQYIPTHHPFQRAITDVVARQTAVEDLGGGLPIDSFYSEVLDALQVPDADTLVEVIREGILSSEKDPLERPDEALLYGIAIGWRMREVRYMDATQRGRAS
jgi:hypothetical protein